MAINFPISPTVGDLYTYNGYIWQYVSGGYWKAISEQDSIYSATTVGSGTSVISGITGGNLYLKSFSGNNITITESNGTLTFSAGTGGGSSTSFTGGTVSGATNFIGGLTANTISANTYFNLPVSAVTNGTGISASTSNGIVTITNTQIQGITGKTDGSGISSSISNNVITIINTGATSVTASDGISGNTTTGAISIVNTDKGSSQNIFKNIQAGGITQFSANSNSANLNFSGINITITSAATNTLVFSAGTGSGGVTSVTATSGLSGNSTTGAITIINTGVTGITAGSGISVNQSTGNVTVSYTGSTVETRLGLVYTTGNNLNFI